MAEQQQATRGACPYCGSASTVVFLNERSEPRRGNPFRRRCRSCEKHVRMESKTVWRQSTKQYVQPPDADELVPLADYNPGPDHVYSFSCPSCAEAVVGQPDACPSCGVQYQWDD